jgi:hypothetical protein
LEISGFWKTRVFFELRHGQNIPAWYGWAGYNEATDRVEVMPLGLNYLYSMLMWVYYEIVEGCQSRAHSYTFKVARETGQFAGYQQGYMHGYVDGKNNKPNKVLETQRATLTH